MNAISSVNEKYAINKEKKKKKEKKYLKDKIQNFNNSLPLWITLLEKIRLSDRIADSCTNRTLASELITHAHLEDSAFYLLQGGVTGVREKEAKGERKGKGGMEEAMEWLRFDWE